LGGRIASGRQYISWIHCADMNRLFLAALDRSELSGVINATAPNPVTNKEFMSELRAALHRPWSPPVPAWAVHIGSWLMGTEACLALTGRRCISRRLAENKFSFQFPTLKEALRDIYR
jgi:NAD dependent epimerase/dehydratase family enzyme